VHVRWRLGIRSQRYALNKVVMLLSNPFVSDPHVYAEALALSENGYDVTVVAWDRTCAHPETEDRGGIHIRRVRVRATFGQGTRQLLPFLAFWRQAISALSQMKVDVVHCHDLDTLFAGWVVARRQDQAKEGRVPRTRVVD